MIYTPLGIENLRIREGARSRTRERLFIALVFMGMALATVGICYLQLKVFGS
jgi:hypothetical protein